MLLRLSDIAHLSLRKARPIPMALALALVVISVKVQAQTWQVDSNLSVARLSLGAESNAAEIGVARVSGQIVFDADHPANPTVDLKIAPGIDEDSQNVRMGFTSMKSTMTSDGRLIVTGNLAVTRVEQSVTMDPSEAFAGPVFGESVAHTAVRPITFVLNLSPAGAVITRKLQLSGTTAVARASFPQFLDALTLANWPTQLVNNQKCKLPLTVGEDFSGADCTGTSIASVSNAERRIGSGEDFSGFKSAAVPDLDHGSIKVNIWLAQAKPVPSAVAAE